MQSLSVCPQCPFVGHAFQVPKLGYRGCSSADRAMPVTQASTPVRWWAGLLRTARGRAPPTRSRLPGRRHPGPGQATAAATLRFQEALGPLLGLCRPMVLPGRACPWRPLDTARALLPQAMASRHLRSRHGSGREGSVCVSQYLEDSGLATDVDEHSKHMI